MPTASKETTKGRRHSAIGALKLAIRDEGTIARNKIKGTELKWNGNLRPGLRKFHKYTICVDIDSKAVTALYNLSKVSHGEGIRKLSPIHSGKGENNILQRIISPIYAIPYKENLKSFHPSNSNPLDYYIMNGGNCITKSLMAIAVLQRYREEGNVDGTFGIRHSINKNTGEGHAWVSYKGPEGITIVDPTHGLLVKLGDNETNKMMESFLINNNGWNYFDVGESVSALRDKSIFNSFVVGYSLIGEYVMHIGAMNMVAIAAVALQASSLIKYRKDIKRQTG